ncbi:protein of unknown function [Candidatus Nitrosocosmicus franklandus]|uniref:Uncharacterized protein n=1 Tax=Candidatus Nitrosocosmicus franklandianus TaxID=1798806 RepID=A0A484I3R1_9ARCH|nr:protein of unknown function [Candidatus Nitrosocosmicus franklandus]
MKFRECKGKSITIIATTKRRGRGRGRVDKSDGRTLLDDVFIYYLYSPNQSVD